MENHLHGQEAGGLSGAPLAELSTRTVRNLSSVLAGKIPIIAAGGIVDAASALVKLDAGASLVQIYTGFIYQGPQLIEDIVESINTPVAKASVGES